MPVVKPANRKNTVAPRPWRIGGLGTNILDADGDQIALVSGMPPIGNQGDTANAAHIVKAVNALENGNTAAMRQALMDINENAASADETNYKKILDGIVEITNAALAAPARNCDRFSDPFEATRAWNDYCVQVAERGGKILGWAEWLFATAKEGGAK